MTQFQVQLFHAITDPAPFATADITAKMPLGALAFGFVRLAVTQAARVDIRDGDEVTTFYHVAIKGTQLHYTREVAVIEEENSSPPQTKPGRRKKTQK